MKKRLGSGIRTVLLAGAAAFILGGAAFGAEGDVLPQVLLDSQWDWYSTSDPEYKDLFHNQYELARLNQESAAVYPELDSALKAWSGEKQARQEEYNSHMHELADDVYENEAQVLPLTAQSDLYVRRADEKVLSLLEFTASYEGGVHGMYGYFGYNFDSRTGEKLTLDRVFRNTDDLPGLIAETLRKTYPGMSFHSLDESLSEDFSSGTYADWNWTLDPNGVTFYFAPYYLASYADGSLEAFIPFRGNESIFTGEFGEQTGAWAMGMPDFFNQNYMRSDGSWHKLLLIKNPDEYDAFNGLTIEKDGNQTAMPGLWYYEADFSLVHAADGAYYLYAMYTSENDYSSICVYDLYGTPYKTGSIEGSYADRSGGPADAEDQQWRCVLSHPERFTVNSVIQYLSTCFGNRDYVPGPDGMPVPQTPYYEFDYTRNLTLKRDLTLQGVAYSDDGSAGNETGEVIVKSGETLSFWRTDGESYMDLKRADGSAVRCRLDESHGWPYTIGGVDIEEAFDGIMFAG